MKLALFIFVFAIFSIPSFAQVTAKNRVFIHKESGQRNGTCNLQNALIDKSGFEKLNRGLDCSASLFPKQIDFEKHSLITYEMRGDCRISGAAEISLDEKSKLYTVYLSNYWGRCRAGGKYAGWLLIDKIRDGFDVEFEETRVEGQLTPFLKLQPGAEELVEASEANLNGCVWLGSNEQKMLSSEKEYLAAIRQDAQTETCKSKLSGLDFARYAYTGVGISSGYCRRPSGLSFSVEEYGGSKNFVVQIKYTEPRGL